MEDETSPETEDRSQAIAHLLESQYGQDFGFDPETCTEIAAMSFPEAFEVAYGYLTQSGLDPEIILSAFMEPPEEE